MGLAVPDAVADTAEDGVEDFEGEAVFEEADYAACCGHEFFEGDVELVGGGADEVDSCGVELDCEHGWELGEVC